MAVNERQPRRRILASALGALLIVIGSAASSTPGDQCEDSPLVHGACIDVAGELQVLNGWPPNLGVRTDGKLLGIGPVGNEIFPEYLKDYLPKGVSGTFRLCPLAQDAAAPYREDPIPLYCLQSAAKASYFDENSRRVSLPAPPN